MFPRKTPTPNDLFWQAAYYHTLENYPKCKPYITEGVFICPARIRPLTHGEENAIYNGLFLVVGKKYTASDLHRENVILRYNKARKFKNFKHLLAVQQKQKKVDGGYYINLDTNAIWPVGEFSNTPKGWKLL